MPVDMIRIAGERAVLNEPPAGGIVVVPRIVAIPRAIVVEAIRRVAVHVYPRARRGFNGARQRQSQTTTVSRLLVPVLVERRLLSPTKLRKRPTRHKRSALAAAPFAREIPRLDLVEGPFLRTRAFFKAAASRFGRSVGRERHPIECIGARVARPDLTIRYRPDKRRQKQQLARHVSIVSAPSGTTDIELHIAGIPSSPGKT